MTAGKTAKEVMMKKNRLFVLAGAAAMVLAFSVVLAGCPNTSGSSGSSDPAYSGKFTMDDGRDVFFELDNAGSSSASLSIMGGRSLAVTGSTSITGRLKDPSGVRQLHGTYDPDSGVFEVSADGDSLRHRIRGIFGSNKQVLAANALVYTKGQGDDQSLDAFDVVERSGAIGGGGAAMTGTFPNAFLGTWLFRDEEFRARNDWDGVTTMAITFSPYTFYVFHTDDGHKDGFGRVEQRKEYGGLLVEISPRITDAAYPNGYYDAIFVLPGYNDELTPAERAPVNALFEDYLESKGISVPVRVTPDWANGPDWNEWAENDTTQEYYISQDGSVFCHNFPVGTVGDDWLVILSRWRSANPTSQYMKIRFWIDGFGKLQMGVYGEFDNLTAAQNANGGAAEMGEGFTRQ